MCVCVCVCVCVSVCVCVCVRSHQKKNNRFTVCVQSHKFTCAYMYVISPLSLNQSVAMAVSNTILLDDFLRLCKF